MHGVIPTTLNEIELSSTPALKADAVKLQIKSHSERDSALIDDWIAAAETNFRQETGRPVMIGTFEYWLDEFPAQRIIQLPLPPLRTVESVTYINADGDETAFEDYTTILPTGVYAPRGGIEVSSASVWPTALAKTGAVKIRFTAGYAEDAKDVPALVQTALRYMVADFDRFRTNTFVPVTGSPPVTIPFGVEAILRGFKYSALQTIVPRRCL